MTLRRVAYSFLVLVAFLVSQISPAYFAFGFAALFWLLAMRRSKSAAPSLSSWPSALALLYAILVVLSTVFSRDPAASARHVAGLSLLLILPMTMDLADAEERARLLFYAIAANSVILSWIGFWQFAHGGNDMENRIAATLSHWMTFSGLAMISGCLLLGFLLEDRGPRRWIGALAVFPLAAMVLTFTRSVWVGTLLAILVYFAVRKPRGLLVFVPALLAAFFLLPPAIRARAATIGSLDERTNRDRIAMVHAGVRMVREAPVFGIGPEMVKRYYTLYRDPDAPQWEQPHLHDNILQTAAASGLFAAAAYLALMFLFFARAVSRLRRATDPGRAALLAGSLLAGIALFIAGFFEYNWGDTEVEMATLIVLAMPFSGAVSRD
ncbi:MAG TPA: O-antigen ligase family protein [Thermoanaerobaculia bacterium]|nr:O-antigen ligase family protein [Thermoanaerobaculia bacterium]